MFVFYEDLHRCISVMFQVQYTSSQILRLDGDEGFMMRDIYLCVH